MEDKISNSFFGSVKRTFSNIFELNEHFFQKCESSLEVQRAKRNENFQTMLVIIFQNFKIFQYRSDSPQVKGAFISSIANLVYELPHELPNDLRLRKYQKNIKFGQTHSLVHSLPLETQTLQIAVKKHPKTAIKLSFSCPVLLNNPILFQIFCPAGIVVNIDFQY